MAAPPRRNSIIHAIRKVIDCKISGTVRDTGLVAVYSRVADPDPVFRICPDPDLDPIFKVTSDSNPVLTGR